MACRAILTDGRPEHAASPVEVCHRSFYLMRIAASLLLSSLHLSFLGVCIIPNWPRTESAVELTAKQSSQTVTTCNTSALHARVRLAPELSMCRKDGRAKRTKSQIRPVQSLSWHRREGRLPVGLSNFHAQLSTELQLRSSPPARLPARSLVVEASTTQPLSGTGRGKEDAANVLAYIRTSLPLFGRHSRTKKTPNRAIVELILFPFQRRSRKRSDWYSFGDLDVSIRPNWSGTAMGETQWLAGDPRLPG